MKQTFSVAAALLATFSIASADDTIKCGPSNLCPQSAPCCSQYGQCGVGAYCLGGCDPTSSFSLQSCMAAPVCKSGDFTMDSLDDVQANTVYLGDSTKANWVSSGTPVTYNGDSLLLTMAPSTVGTLLTSTHYVWFGKISVTMTSSQGQGVVTAAILMSDVKDEIDFEFVGDDVQNAQSNYYWQGVTDYHNMVSLDAANTNTQSHTYTVDWNQDSITWSIDGNEMRTLNKADTWNSTDNTFHYPQTPSRVQLSLWPAGLASNGQGTVQWAGGLVNWDDTSAMRNGYYYARVNDVNIECYDPPSGVDASGSAYYYTSRAGTNSTVAIGDNSTILSSFYASGDNPTFDPNAKASASGSSTASSASMTATPNTVPGVSGGGNAASSGESPTGGDNSDASSSGSSGSDSSSSGSTSSGSSSGFSQGTDSTGSSGAPKIVAGSAVALLGFFVAALML